MNEVIENSEKFYHSTEFYIFIVSSLIFYFFLFIYSYCHIVLFTKYHILFYHNIFVMISFYIFTQVL